MHEVGHTGGSLFQTQLFARGRGKLPPKRRRVEQQISIMSLLFVGYETSRKKRSASQTESTFKSKRMGTGSVDSRENCEQSYGGSNPDWIEILNHR